MDSFFPTAKIYNPKGQNYLSVDRELMLAYKESAQGQLLHPGINEAGQQPRSPLLAPATPPTARP